MKTNALLLILGVIAIFQALTYLEMRSLPRDFYTCGSRDQPCYLRESDMKYLADRIADALRK